MLGFFTDPYPDELLYSALARFSERARYPNRKSVLLEIFGNQKISAIFDFPTRLNNFISSLYEGSLYKTETLISEHTLFPYYEPFLPVERSILIRNEMAGSTDNKIHVRLGIRVQQVKNPSYIRFCPLCASEDRNKFGETYWHRIHQLAGILICPEHNCFLENSRLKWDKKLGYHFFSAEKFIKSVSPKYIDDKDKNHLILLKLAKDAKWLLSQKKLQVGTKIIRERYFNLLLKQTFAYYNGRVRHNKLLKACQDYFSPAFFKTIGRVSERDNWISILVQESNTDITYHPIRHLLLITFLGITAEEFFTDFLEFKPFFDPPYPCLNKASDHYQDLRINECQVFDNLSKDKSRSGRPLGVFACDCGFVYQRVGPDSSEQDRHTFSLVREYGEIWENKLRELWMDLTLSGSKIGTLLGISQVSVVRHAIRLDLPMNTPDSRTVQGYARHRNPNKSFSEMRTQYRQEWLKTVEENPEASRQDVDGHIELPLSVVKKK